VTLKASTPCGEMPRLRANSRSRCSRRFREDRRRAGTVRNYQSSRRRPRRLRAGILSRVKAKVAAGSVDGGEPFGPRPISRLKRPNPGGTHGLHPRAPKSFRPAWPLPRCRNWSKSIFGPISIESSVDSPQSGHKTFIIGGSSTVSRTCRGPGCRRRSKMIT